MISDSKNSHLLSVTGNFLDGKTSKKIPATLLLDNKGYLQIVDSDDQDILSVKFSETRTYNRIGNTRRQITFPNGEIFETSDNDRVDDLLKFNKKEKGNIFIHRLEQNFKLALMSIVIIAFSILLFWKFGIPLIASIVAPMVPDTVINKISDETVITLDKYYFQKTSLNKKTQQRLTKKFSTIIKSQKKELVAGSRYKLLFRSSKTIGANAFALPSGTIIITDQLINYAKNDKEIISILAHEVGHVVKRHGTKSILQNSVVTILISYITGDVSALSSMSVAIPTFLINTGYTKNFEEEADNFSYNYLVKNKISTHYFADIMKRIEKDFSKTEIPSIFSTHPSTNERIKKFEKKRI